MNKDTLLKVTIKNKDNETVEEEIQAVSSFNERGPFDILPMHENFITVITKSIVLHKKGSAKSEMTIERGVLRIFENQVSIYLGI